MLLSVGTKLGPYEIIVRIDGGIGEVYRARDTRLNRGMTIQESHENFSERFGARPAPSLR
jgi:hypothetical protein